ncbi:helix-turn-helix domain-containing protein [Cellulosilyticum ruminicola]|uniref:helix-turn-helix domain-containing protein n=1 Tax=Cellulosilyticum ruminicola TaxID=425254 RepID=UPI0006CF3EE1|nr:helix-turn-helix domain-containing protein [Cellulosilyticum ruminicola]
MIQKQEIIMAALNGKSQRAIAREFGIGRNTVRRYIKQYYASREKLIATNPQSEDFPLIIQQVVEKPKYDTSSRSKTKLTPEVMHKIQMYLEQNHEKREHGIHK